MSFSTILLILAFIAFVLAAIGCGYKKTNFWVSDWRSGFFRS